MAILDSQTADKFGYNNMKNRVVRNLGRPVSANDAQTFACASYTTTERDAITNKTAGMLVYNSTTNKHQGWDGSTWNNLY